MTAAFAAMAALALSSCASYKTSAPVLPVTGTVATHVAADIDYSSAKRVQGSVQDRRLFWIIPLNFNKETLLYSSSPYFRWLSTPERMALYRAKENNQVDMILDPEIDSEKHSWFFGIYRTSKTTAKGWGVTLKGLKEDTYGQAHH